MLTNWHTVLEIALRTTAVYALVLVGIRLTGKREVGQMTPFDLRSCCFSAIQCKMP